jgi:hypothetical protein
MVDGFASTAAAPKIARPHGISADRRSARPARDPMPGSPRIGFFDQPFRSATLLVRIGELLLGVPRQT